MHITLRSKDRILMAAVMVLSTISCAASLPAAAGPVIFQDTFEGYQEIFDGTSTGVDKSVNDGSLTSLSANWSNYTDSASGLQYYEYSFGTVPGATDVKTWTANSTTTSVTATSLSLQTGVIYYANARSIDNAGNTSTVASSDGQMVAPSLSFGVSPSTVTFSSLNAGNSYTDTEPVTLTTSTNASSGYQIHAYASGLLQSGIKTIPAYNGGTYASPDSWQSGDTGFGFTSSDTSVQGSNIFQNNPCPGSSALAAPGCYAPYNTTAPGTVIADRTSPTTSSEQFTITNRVTVSNIQSAATYTTTLIYKALAVY